jgi:predicted AAA+ superfamily ATPase
LGLANAAKRPWRGRWPGSAAPDVVRGVSESLAGRVGFVDLGGFNLREVGTRDWRRLWLRGGFPRSSLASNEAASMGWRRDFIGTFLERDIPQMGVRIPSQTLRRFWMMVAHFHGQIWNGADLARSLGISEHTVRSYVDLLTGTFMLRQLQPWFENVSTRQYKAPKVYVRDTGLLHALLGLARAEDLAGHPKFGSSWEGFALEQVLAVTGTDHAYYWGTHAGAELDLVLFRKGRRNGVEFKTSDGPNMTKSLHVALGDLKLDRAWIIYPGTETYKVHERVEVVPLSGALSALAKFGT